jgi:hypothetical protein
VERHRILSAVLVLSLLACAQAPKPQGKVHGAEYYELFTRAKEFEKKGDFAGAAALYDRLTKSYPDDTEIWVQLGAAHGAAGHFTQAAEAYSQALGRGGEYPGSLAYRIASSYARAGDKDRAMEWLAKALAVPFENRPRIALDDAFAPWREDNSFRKAAGLAPKTSMSREAGWNYDLDFLLTEVRRMHYSYRNGTLPRGYEEAVRQLRQRISKLSDSAMEPEIQRLLAGLGDGHTALRAGPSKHIPFAFYDFSDGVFVIDAPADCQCIGARVLGIGEAPIQEVLRKIAPFLSVDNAMGIRLQAPVYLRFVEYLKAAGITSSENEVTLSLEMSGAKRQVMARPTDGGFVRRKLFPSKLAGAGAVPLYLQHVDDNYWFQVLPDEKTLYFQFNQVLNKPQETIAQFAVPLHRALASSKIRNLIVDLRHNSGGNLNLFPPLLRAIIAFEASQEGAGLYVITGRQTFSAAQVFLNELDRYTSAIVAGEPSGSRPNFVGESAPTTLPVSGLQMTISTRYHQTEDQDQRTWIAPKIPVELSSRDYFSNRDPVLDAVLRVIRDRSR